MYKFELYMYRFVEKSFVYLLFFICAQYITGEQESIRIEHYFGARYFQSLQTLTELGSCINMEWYTREFLLQSRHLHDQCSQLNRNQRLRNHRNRKNSFKIAKCKIIVFLSNVKKSHLKLMNREIDELYDFFLC